MKKLLLTFVCAAAALGVCAAPEKIGFDKLPKSSQEFIQKNFPVIIILNRKKFIQSIRIIRVLNSLPLV